MRVMEREDFRVEEEEKKKRTPKEVSINLINVK